MEGARRDDDDDEAGATGPTTHRKHAVGVVGSRPDRLRRGLLMLLGEDDDGGGRRRSSIGWVMAQGVRMLGEREGDAVESFGARARVEAVAGAPARRSLWVDVCISVKHGLSDGSGRRV